MSVRCNEGIALSIPVMFLYSDPSKLCTLSIFIILHDILLSFTIFVINSILTNRESQISQNIFNVVQRFMATFQANIHSIFKVNCVSRTIAFKLIRY